MAQRTSDLRPPPVSGVTRCRKKDGEAITVPRGPGRGGDPAADLELQVTAFIVRWIAELNDQRDLARLVAVAAIIDVSVVMAAFLAVIDRALQILEPGQRKAVELGIETQHDLRESLIEFFGFGIALKSGEMDDVHDLEIVALDRALRLLKYLRIAIGDNGAHFRRPERAFPGQERPLYDGNSQIHRNSGPAAQITSDLRMPETMGVTRCNT